MHIDTSWIAQFLVWLCVGSVSLQACSKATRSKERATAKQCDGVAAKYAEHLAKRMKNEGETVPEIVEPAMRSMTSSAKKSCMEYFDRHRAQCALEAADFDTMAACTPKVDFRPKADRPSPGDCNELGSHLESLYIAATAPLAPDADKQQLEHHERLEKMVAKIVSNALHECSLTMSKDYVDCQMKTEVLSDLRQCAPIPLDTSEVQTALDEVIKRELTQPMQEIDSL